jgi:tripartite-type tricarboxylate transporter receptor subunit TctC
MLADVLSGRVGMMITDTINILPRVRSKELVPIAVAGAKRSPMLPDVPTFAESGYPGVVAGPWFSMVAPAGTPLDIREKLAQEIHAVLEMPAVNKRLTDLGVEVRGTPPQEFEAFLKSEYRRWGEAIRAAGIAVR